MRARRGGLLWLRRACFGAAGVIAIAAAVGPLTGAAGAGAATPPQDYTYSSMVTAVGTQAQLSQNPEPSSIPDLTDAETPYANAQLDSYGTSQGDGYVSNENGAGAAPSLICLASSSTCQALSVGGTSFPPPNPLDAHAAYPTPEDASAPTLDDGPATASSSSAPVPFTDGSATAHADQTNTSTSAQVSNTTLPNSEGTVGGAVVTTTQTVDETSIRTHAESKVSDVNIGGSLIHIGSIDSVSDVTSKPDGTSTDTTTSTASGVMVLGQAATIDSTGIHIVGSSAIPTTVTSAYQSVLGNDLKAAGLTITLAKATSTDSDVGRTTAATGLEIQYDTDVAGTPPITAALPSQVPCPVPAAVLASFPVNPCAGVGLSVNATYHGQVLLGQVGIISMTLAGPSDDFSQPTIPLDTPTGSTDTGTPVAGSVPTVAASSPVITPTSAAAVPVPVGSAPPTTTASGVVTGGAVVAAPTEAGSSPEVAAAAPASSEPRAAALRPVASIDPLSGRFWWFFPLLLLGSIGLIAGRFLKAPARLPLWLK